MIEEKLHAQGVRGVNEDRVDRNDNERHKTNNTGKPQKCQNVRDAFGGRSTFVKTFITFEATVGLDEKAASQRSRMHVFMPASS